MKYSTQTKSTWEMTRSHVEPWAKSGVMKMATAFNTTNETTVASAARMSRIVRMARIESYAVVTAAGNGGAVRSRRSTRKTR